jgi:hypothetical protein
MITANPTLAVHAGEEQTSRPARAVEQRWSVTGEEFDAQSLSHLIIANDWLLAGHVVYACESRVITVRDLISADDVIPLIAQRAKALAGDGAKEYPCVTDIEKRILNGALGGWLALTGLPEFFSVENVRKHTLTDSDLDVAARVVIGGAQ